MNEPWAGVPPDDYERHMAHPSVAQTALLASIVRSQLAEHRPASLVYFGIATGNGLEHVDPSRTHRVTGIDINERFLEVCRTRFGSRGYVLELLNADLNRTPVSLPAADLFIANLFLEYVPVERILPLVTEFGNPGAVLSTVIQENNGAPFVSRTGVESLAPLEAVHRDVSIADLNDTMLRNRFTVVRTSLHPAPGGKTFRRTDYRMEER